MRIFMVGFLIFILGSSLALLIFKPMFNKNNAENIQDENSRVEKLITGKNDIAQKTTNHEEIKSNFKPFEDELDLKPNKYIPPERPNHEEYMVKHDNTNPSKKVIVNENIHYESIKNITPEQNQINEKAIKEFENQMNSNQNLKSVTNELKEKYNNNPNAEVSNDDINYFMIKLLDSMQK